MTTQASAGGYGVSFWGAEHKRNGKLICRQIIVEPPDPVTCPKFSCIMKFMKNSFMYIMVMYYHKVRAEYAEANPEKNIPDKYRTGEDAPTTFWKLVWEIIKVPK